MELINPKPCKIIKATNNIEVRLVDHQPRLTHSVEEAVNEAWKQAEKSGKTNGKTIGLLEYTIEYTSSPEGQLIIKAHIGQYKHFYAPRINPAIGGIITPIGVCGVISDTEENYLIGRRSKNVTQYPGYLEFPPSGGLNAQDQDGNTLRIKDSMLRELCGETVFAPEHVKSLEPLGLIYDENDNVYDIAFRIILNAAFSSKRSNLKEEYVEEIIVPLNRIHEVMKDDLSVPSMPTLYQMINF